MLCEARRLHSVDPIQPYGRSASSFLHSTEEAKALLDEGRVNEFRADKITCTASLLAATTGMRLDEVQALRIEDIHRRGRFVLHRLETTEPPLTGSTNGAFNAFLTIKRKTDYRVSRTSRMVP
jgi:integrase